ncbi:MAG TPA: hypothetical protein VIC08_08415 [Cellvibrionaceae bacterium]
MTLNIKSNALAIAGSLTLLIAPLTLTAEEEEKRISYLEQQLQQLQRLANQPAQERLRFNGFLSVGYGLASNDGGYADFTEEGTFKNESLFGLQGSFTISDNTEVIMQLVGRGSDGWEPTLEWAYISHNFTPDFKVRAGKMRMPLFMYSDSLEVGYAQPWLRPPEEVYGGIPVTSYIGIDGIYDFQLNNSTLSAQLFGGESEEELTISGQPTVLIIDNLFGTVISWTDFTWTLRANYATSEISTGGSLLETDFYGAGASFNNGVWQVISEFTRLEIDGPTTDVDSAYLTLARNFGGITPYFTYSIRSSQDDQERPLSRGAAFAAIANPDSPFFGNTAILSASDIQNVERTAYSVGIRWEATTSVSLKFDITHATDFGDTGGGLDGNLAPEVLYDDVNLYSIKLDAAF